MQDFNISYLDKDFQVTVTSYIPYTPAKTNCLPEDSYPEEGEEIEFKITEGQDNAEFLEAAVDAWEEFSEYIVANISEQISEMGEPDEPD